MKSIRRIVRNVAQHWVGDGFPVRTMLSYGVDNPYDPFLLLDYAGPYDFPPGQAVRGVGEHPHRGFETATIVYQGELEHRDSSGSRGSIGPGDVQWMTAAAGVVHEEYHSPRFAREGGTLEMVQLWVNLPARLKMSPPRYQHLPSDSIPSISLPNGAGAARVIAGTFDGADGPAATHSPIRLLDMRMSSSRAATLSFEAGHTALVLVLSGVVKIDGETARPMELVELQRDDSDVAIETVEEAKLLVLSGEPLREPVAGYGPFVMNTRDEIRQALRDYQEGRMGRL